MKKLAGVVLAAGLGTRMKSDRAKVLHPVLGRPMLRYPLEALARLKVSRISVVVGHQGDRVREAFGDFENVSFVTQNKQLGTADALKTGLRPLQGFEGTVVVVNGDSPLITAETLSHLVSFHRKGRYSLTVSTFLADDPAGYGRIIRGDDRCVTGIVEKKDATEAQLQIREVNGGFYVLEPEVLPLLGKIGSENASGEYYLTDMVALAAGRGFRVGACTVDSVDLMGVNSRIELAEAGRLLARRINHALMSSGVTMVQPESVIVCPDVKVGVDTIIYPNVTLEGKTRVGKDCVLFPGVRIVDSQVEDGVTVKDGTLIEESRVGKGSSVGPFAHLRPGSVLKKNVKVGNFVELKKAVLGNGAKASHLSYLGDATIGADVNIGAGTITCNYDGQKKHRTTISEGVFIGSDTQLVAPVRIGKGAYVGAGSTVTSDVPAGSLAVSRVRQKNIKGWVKDRARKKKD